MAQSGAVSVGVIGARGHTGAEMLRLLHHHPKCSIAFVSSRELAGQPVEGFDGALHFEEISPGEAAERRPDVVILALPNGKSEPFIEAIHEAHGDAVLLIDLSGDHRFDVSWAYGLPERFRDTLRTARRISNPGCYATGAQLAIAPMLGELSGAAHVFGVSGYSGAGTTPSDKNDLDKLRDNLMPYSLIGHLHEREITRHLNHPVAFMPHVAPFFRGITLTVSLPLARPMTTEALEERYRAAYADEPLVRVSGGRIPLVRDIARRHHVEIGGFVADQDNRRAVVVATIDNLLKGAATQAMQNLNLACGFDELEGIRPWLKD